MNLKEFTKIALKEFAPGIPTKGLKRPIRKSSKETWKFNISEHLAQRAGKHFDFRMGDPKRDVAYSWAGRKLPEPGEKVMVVRQSDHCLVPQTIIETENGEKTIREIVDNSYTGCVRSYNYETGEFDWKQVYYHHKHRVDEELICLEIYNGKKRRQLRMTKGHKVWTGDGYTLAGDLTKQHEIFIKDLDLSDIQRQVILGDLLGDGSMAMGGQHATYRIGQSTKEHQAAFFMYKYQSFSEFMGKIGIYNVKPRKIGSYTVSGTKLICAKTRECHAFDEFYHLCYPDGKKTVTRAWLDKINEIGMAFWFMGDGSCAYRTGKNGNVLLMSADLSTQGFSKQGVDILQEWLLDKWGLDSFTTKDKQGEYKIIRFNKTNAVKLFKLVSPYMVHEMIYKLGERHRQHHYCIKCSEEIRSNMRYCNNCILDNMRDLGIPTQQKYGEIPKSKRFSSLRSVVLRFGGWKKARDLAKSGARIPTLVDYTEIIPGDVSSLCHLISGTKSHWRLWPTNIKKITKFRKKGFVYNIGVRDNKNYIANGILTSNSTPYMNFHGKIRGGYGAGQVKRKRLEDIEVVSSSPDKITFNAYPGKDIEEYSMIRFDGDKWLLINKTPDKDYPVPSSKPKYREKKPGNVDLGSNEIMQGKVDGAHNTFLIKARQPVRAFSYRPSERKTGPIQHTDRIEGMRYTKGPNYLDDTVVRGETAAIDIKGKALPASELGGILNANVFKARKKLETRNARLMNYIFDVVRFRGEDYENKPYEEKKEVLQYLTTAMPHLFQLPPEARTPKDKKALYHRILKGREPLTREGVVLWDPDKPDGATKVKFKPEFDVRIKDIFTKARSKAKEEAGGIVYDEVDGDGIGRDARVGTGFSRRLKQDMYKNPEKYKGIIAKINAMEQLPSGALRAPSFSGWHLDRNNPDKIPNIKK